MIVLDTNVLSELMRPRPDQRVLAWMDGQPTATLWTTSITVAEIFLGLAKLPKGKRRTGLLEAASVLVAEDFRGRILPFSMEDALEYAAIVAGRITRGRPIGMADAQLAAICVRHGATFATRNVRDFLDVGVDVVNPWSEAV